MIRTALILIVAFAIAPPVVAQPMSAELSITGGGSTEEVGAGATQLSVFGDLARDVRVYVEAAWGSRSTTRTDVFGAAYPYDKRVRPIETYIEKIFRGDRLVAGVRGGRYRTPFGIYGRGDHAYAGFLRAPLIRYDGYWALSNRYLEGGVDLFAATPHVQFETSLGVPQDVGTAVRRRGLDQVYRMQGYHGGLVAGVSHVRHLPYERRSFANGEAEYTGIDLRWMNGGTQLRGEWIVGKPFDGPSTTGWYVDAMVHRRRLAPFTLVGRIEELDYDAGSHSMYRKRYTGGTRLQVSRSVVGHVNVVHEPNPTRTRKTALDVAITYVLRYPW